ncbi:MAG: hypothetical protein CSA15_07695, partial [Candidatus Delongbacteria bacterium]
MYKLKTIIIAVCVLFTACGSDDDGSTSPTTNVYVAGYEHNGTRNVAKYWKNGEEIALTDGSQNAYAYDITIDNGNVYVVGNESNGTNNVAKYWKNGTEVTLTNGSHD